MSYQNDHKDPFKPKDPYGPSEPCSPNDPRDPTKPLDPNEPLGPNQPRDPNAPPNPIVDRRQSIEQAVIVSAYSIHLQDNYLRKDFVMTTNNDRVKSGELAITLFRNPTAAQDTFRDLLNRGYKIVELDHVIEEQYSWIQV